MLTAERLPTRLMFEPTSRCNLRCPLCITGRGEVPRKPDMTPESFRMVYDQFELGCTELTFHNFGEPLLNRTLPRMIEYAKSRGCVHAAMSTNGTLLTDAWCTELATCGLDELLVSIDGLTQETYEMYRVGGKLENVKQGIRRLMQRVNDCQSKLFVVMQWIPFRHNEHELDDVYETAADLGVHALDIKVSGSASKTTTFKPADPALQAANRSSLRDGPLCDWVFTTIVVNTDGHVMPCCWAGHNPLYSMGNVFEHPIEEIWNSARYHDLRERVGTRQNLWTLCQEKCVDGPQSKHVRLPVVNE